MLNIYTLALSVILRLLISPTSLEVQQMSRQLPVQAPASVIDAITEAVTNDVEPPLLGSYRAEAALMLTYAWEESAFHVCAVGDHGASLGLFQLQRLPKSIACDPRAASKIFLARAHASYNLCTGLPENERLSAFASGNCGHGHMLTRHRVLRSIDVERRSAPAAYAAAL